MKHKEPVDPEEEHSPELSPEAKKPFTARDPTNYSHSYFKEAFPVFKTLIKDYELNTFRFDFLLTLLPVCCLQILLIYEVFKDYLELGDTQETFNVVISIQTCIRHFTKSRGTTAVCVRPQLKTPPKPHSA